MIKKVKKTSEDNLTSLKEKKGSPTKDKQRLEIQEVIITHSEHRLEGRYYKNQDKNAPTAIILPPNPLQGGTMNNKVVYRTFHALISIGFSVLRFNYRGVGKSEGTHDGGTGELHDAAVALDWMQCRHIEANGYWVVGFSFGAWLGLQLLMRRPEIDGFVSISPPATLYPFDFISPCPIPGLIIQGTDDTISRESDSYALFQKLHKQKNAQVDYHLINGADHFYNNHIPDLTEKICSFIKETINVTREPRYKKAKRVRSRKENIT